MRWSPQRLATWSHLCRYRPRPNSSASRPSRRNRELPECSRHPAAGLTGCRVGVPQLCADSDICDNARRADKPLHYYCKRHTECACYTMHPWLAERTAKFDSSGIRKVFDLAAKMSDPINLSIGQPDFAVPDAIKDAAIAAIRGDKN